MYWYTEWYKLKHSLRVQIISCIFSRGNISLRGRNLFGVGGEKDIKKKNKTCYSNLWSSILKEISPGCSLEGMMLKLKLQYFGHVMRRVDSLEKTLMLGGCWEGLGAGGEGDDRGRDGWMASLTRWTWVWVNSGSWWLTGRPGVLRFMGSHGVGHNWATELKDPQSFNWYIYRCYKNLIVRN